MFLFGSHHGGGRPDGHHGHHGFGGGSPAFRDGSSRQAAQGGMALAAATEPAAPGARIRLFACSGRSCRAGGGAALLEALRREIAAAGPRAAGIDVVACGCLDRCEDGPVVIAYRGAAAQASEPPGEGSGGVPVGTFVAARADDARRIVGAVLTK